MHILILPSWYSTADKPWRGTYVLDQAVALERAGLRAAVAFVERRSLWRFNVLRLVPSHFQTVAHPERGVPTLRMKGWSTFAQTTPGSLFWSRLTQKLLRSYVSKYGVPDVIHAHAALWGGYAAMKSAEILGCPYVVTEHSSAVLTQKLDGEQRAFAATVYRNAAAVIAVSGALKAAVDEIAGTPVAVVVPNTVDTEFFHVPRQRGPGHFTFLAVCNLDVSKRMDLLIGAFGRLRQAHRDIRLAIVGSGKEARHLRSLVRALDAERDIHFTGAVPRWSVRQQMWAANALVLPSDYETFGVVAVEALSTGIPVVATRCGGPEEIVSEETGVLVPRGDRDGLAAAMEQVIRRCFDPNTLHEEAHRRFGHDVVAKRLLDVYSKVTGLGQAVA
jgi:glycosyltransferase involved in cell wall biosynthesis